MASGDTCPSTPLVLPLDIIATCNGQFQGIGVSGFFQRGLQLHREIIFQMPVSAHLIADVNKQRTKLTNTSRQEIAEYESMTSAKCGGLKPLAHSHSATISSSSRQPSEREQRRCSLIGLQNFIAQAIRSWRAVL